MDNKRRVMGKGLEELFSNEKMDFSVLEENIVSSTPKDQIVELEIAELRPNPYQPRKVFDEEKLQELAESIREHGVFQPIIVKKSSIRGYEIIAGERRVKACQIAGVKTIPAIIREFNDDEMMEIALLENLQRENLSAIEEANAYKKLLEKLNVTQEELARRLGKSRSYIPDRIKELISENKISASHARVLSKISDEDKIDELSQKIIDQNLNVRQLEELSQETDVKKNRKITKAKNEYRLIEEELSEKLGTKVKFKKNSFEIYFSNDKDLNRVLEIMNLDD